MATEWMDNLLNGKVNKEAELISQGENAADHFERKVEAHPWVESVLELDPVKVEAEYQAKLAAEAMHLTAAKDIKTVDETPKEVVSRDYERNVKILSDYSLAEMLATARGHREQNTAETYADKKEQAKKEVASSRAKAEKALLELIDDVHSQLDWEKAFAKFTKDAKPEEAKAKDLYQPEVPEKEHDFQHPAENKFKVPADQEDAIPGNGREDDERKEVTQVDAVIQDDITKGLGKEAEYQPKTGEPCSCKPGMERDNCPSCEGTGQKVDFKKIRETNKEAHCGHCSEDKNPLKREELPIKADGPSATDNCPVCGSEGQDLFNNQTDHLACTACGITYASQKPLDNTNNPDKSGMTEEEHLSWDARQVGEFGKNRDGSSRPSMEEVTKRRHEKNEKAMHPGTASLKNPQEIKSQASKEDVLKIMKTAEVESPWKVIKDEAGNEVIARVGIADKNIKESEEVIGKGSIKSADHIHAPVAKDEKLPVEKEIEDEEKPEAKPEEKPEVKPEEKPEAKPAAAAPAPAAVAPVAPVTPAVAVPAAPSASASTGGDTTSPTRTNTETGGSSPGGASTGGVGSGIGGAGTGGAATGGASTGGAGTVTVNVSGGSGTNEDGGKSAPVTINISNVGGNTDAGNVASGDGPGAAGAGGKGDGSGGGGGGAAPDEPRNFSTSGKDEKKDESDPSMFSKDISEAGDSEPTVKPEEKPEEKESTLDPVNSGSDWIRDLLK